MTTRYFTGGPLKQNSDLHIIQKLKETREQQPPEPQDITESIFFESVTDDLMLEAVGKMADQTLRSNAAAAVLTWVDDEDATFEQLDSLIYGFASGGDDDDLTEDELSDYNDMMGYAFEFLVSNGAAADKVQSMEENDDATEAVLEAVKEATKAEDDDELVADFAVRETLMNESKQKVIRNGEVKYIKKKTKKYRQSPAQKAALKKARRKANTSAAKAKRRKSNRARSARGMD